MISIPYLGTSGFAYSVIYRTRSILLANRLLYEHTSSKPLHHMILLKRIVFGDIEGAWPVRKRFGSISFIHGPAN